MQSEVGETNGDQDVANPEKNEQKRALIEMIPEASTPSEIEDDVKQDSMTTQLDEGDSPVESNETLRAWFQRIAQIQNEIQKKLQSEASALRGRSPQVPKSQIQPQTHTMASSQQSTRIVKYQDLPYMGEMTLDNSKPRRGRKPKKADICHLIYKNYGTIFPGTPNPKSLTDKHADKTVKNAEERSNVQHRIISSLLEKRLTQESSSKKAKTMPASSEPLNLCIRDLDHLNLRLAGTSKHSHTKMVDVKEECPESDDEVEFVNETPSTAPSPNSLLDLLPAGSSAILPASGENAPPGGYVYWPSAGVFVHPFALQQQLLYYQKANAAPEETDAGRKTKVAPDDEKKTPTKRKRSAIFIPPIPAENQSNPATEVSICKFKFTGGAKPSLQEKKMLSVDSGGNFRYYSGTGDKSMRGYEFFPRETLQQQVLHNSQGSSTGAFLQASGERIQQHHHQQFMLAPEVKTDLPNNVAPAIAAPDSKGRKRKSRKSIQREKLERTFKEKGFLIQTQQLESAEGATYCKFRQLRKFTRYLFRSWKDYLPGSVTEGQDSAPEALLQRERPDENDVFLLGEHEMSASNLSSPRATENTSPSL